jgi:VCBS repeat-containing protein
MKSFPRVSLGSLRVFSACLLSLLMLMMPIAPLAAAASRESSTPAARKSTAKPKPKLSAREKLEKSLFVNPPTPGPGTPNITATMSDSFVDNNASGKADPGSTVTYTATISNTGTADATGVMFDDTPDPNTAQVIGSVKVSPLAFADSYNVKQNTTLNVVAAGLLTNDTGTPAPTVGGITNPVCVDVTAPFVCNTAQGGTVTVNADGSFTYNPVNAAFTGADTFTYSATNGQAPDDTAVVTINVNANQAPVLANIEPGTLGYGNASPPVQITNTLTVADADDTNIESATVSITNNFVNGEDVLSFTNQNGITGSYASGTGILTLTGSATLANYQTALRSITYSDSAGSPTQSVRTITFVVNDGDVNSNTQTRNINVANNNPPVANDDTAAATEAGGTANGTAGTNPSGNLVTGVGAGSVADTDAEDASSALIVVAVKTGPEGAPLVTGTVGTPLAGSYGSLTLNSDGSYTYTVDNNNATVQALRTSGNTLQDVFNYTIQDTGGAQDTATFTVTIAGANDAPTDIALSASTVPENQPINTVVGAFSTTDVDSGDTFTYTLVAGAGSTDNASFNISGANLQTGAIFDFETKSSYSIRVRTTDAGGLFFEKVFTITVTNVNEAPTDIALSSNTIGENMAINTVIGTFSTTDPDAGDTFTYSLVVGAGDTDNASFNINTNQLRSSAIFDFETKSSYSIRVRSTDSGALNFEKIFTITIVNNNDAPTDIALSNSSVAENSAINTVVGNFSTTDQDAGDTFAYTLVVGTGDTDNASFNINGAQLRTSAIFDFETKSSYSIRVRSTDSGAAFFEKQFTITVTDVAEAPVLVTSGGSAGFTEDGPAVAVDPGITVADQDSPTLASATIQITGNLQPAEDVLAFTNDGSTMGNIAVSVAYNPATGLLTLSSAGNTATLAQWQSALRAVTYNNTSQNPTTTARTVSFIVNDGALASNTATRGVTVTAVNDAPVLAAIEGGALAYTENDAATSITSTMTVADVDSLTLTTATITISSNFQSGQDVLSFVNVPATMGNVAIQSNIGGVLTLTSAGGTATLAQWQAALRAVKYNNSSDDPSTLTRTVTFQVNDGGAVNNLSNTQTRNITITAVNDPPTAFGFTNLPAQAGIPITYPAAKLGGTDLEAGTTVTIFTTPDSTTNGTVTINANGSFTFTPLPGSVGINTASFTYHVCDNGNPGPGVCGSPVTVSFTVAGPAIYFVKNPAVGLANCTLGNECLLATAVTNIGAATNARIFIEDANNHAAAVPLNSGGWLIGQGVTGTTFDTFFGIGAPAQGTLAARPSLGLARPTVQNTVTLNATSTVRGLNIASTTNTGMNDVAAAITAVSVSEIMVTTTTGTPVDLSSNTSGTITFGSITSNGAANGIKLTNTGSSFTVTGTTQIDARTSTGLLFDTVSGTVSLGTTNIPNPNNAGGYGIRIDNSSAAVTISSATISDPHTVTAQADADTNLIPDNDGDGDAIFLKNNTGSFTLSGGTLSNCGNDCIDGRTVQAITLTNVTINTPGQETGGQGAGGHGISFIDLSGTSNLTGLMIQQFLRSQTDGFRTINTNKNATVNVINCRFENSAAAGASDGNDGLFFEGRGTSNMTTVVDEASPDATHFSRFQGLFGDGIQISTGAVSSGTMNTTVKNTDFKDAYQGLTQTGSGNNGLRIAGVGGGKHFVDIQNNTFLNVNKPLFAQGVISLFINNNSEAKGTIAGNSITNSTQAGIQVFADNLAGETITDMDLIIQNNTLNNISSQGILVQMTVAGGTLAGCDFRILNNNIGQTTPVGTGAVQFGFPGGPNSSAEGILVSARGTTKTCRVKIDSNNVKIDANGVNTTFPPANEVLELDVSENAFMSATVTNNQLLQLDDTTNGAAFFANVFNGGFVGTPQMCLDFRTNTGNTNVDFFILEQATNGTIFIENIAGYQATNTGTFSTSGNLVNSAGCAEPPVGITQLLRPNQPQNGYLAARQNTGTKQSEGIANARIGTPYADPVLAPPRSLTSSAEQLTTYDKGVAKTELKRQPVALRTNPAAAVKAANAQPLAQATAKRSAVRTLSHHAKSTANAPLTAKTAKATAMMAPPPALPTFPINIGTIPVGKSVTITFQVTLNSAMPFGTTQVSNQGSVSGSNFATVLTDDQPGTAAPNEPTITPIDAPTASASDVSGDILDSNGLPVEGAAVRMTGTQNRLTVTDANGHYHFDNVETNGFYDVTPSRANFMFSPTDRSFSQLGNHTDAVFTGTYNGGTVNPLDTTEYFVRQQYVDFLNREPDEAGFNFWVHNIEVCGDNQSCRAVKRTDTSAAFFLSVEFQQTGYLVYKIYQSAYGDMPGAPVPLTRAEFKPDTEAIGQGVIVNQTGWETLLENNKQAFTNEFVTRSRFTTAYPTTMTPAEFVDKLFLNAGVTPSDSERSAAIGEFDSAADSSNTTARAKALRRVAENLTLNQQEFNQAFVLMEYFGYLRRSPDEAPEANLNYDGYDFWLSKLDRYNGDYRKAQMVQAFLVAGEYRQRFPR